MTALSSKFRLDLNTAGSTGSSSTTAASAALELEGVSKFDVLLLYTNTHNNPDRGGGPSLFQFYPAATNTNMQQQHVGNNRCTVVCQMHQTEFRQATAAATAAVDPNDDTHHHQQQQQHEDAVLDRVYSIAMSMKCTDLAPPHRLGKFLVRTPELETSTSSSFVVPDTVAFSPFWRELSKPLAREVLRHCLLGPTPSKNDGRGQQQQQQQPAVSTNSTIPSTAAQELPPQQPVENNSRGNAVTGGTGLSLASGNSQTMFHEAAPLSLPIHPHLQQHHHQQQQLEDDHPKRRRRSSLLRRSLSSGDVFSDQKKRFAVRQSILLHLQALDVSSSDNDNEEDDDDKDVDDSKNVDDNKDDDGEEEESNGAESPIKIKDSREYETSTGQKFLTRDSSNEVMMNTTKMMRRASATAASSALTLNTPKMMRRASVASSVSSSTHGGLPKSPLKVILERSPSWSGGLDSECSIVLAANALDVVLQQEPGSQLYKLIPKHTGNNRVMVMVQLRLSKYLTLVPERVAKLCPSTTAQVCKLCMEMVEAVNVSYKGRFLVEQTKNDSDETESYRLLTTEQAVAAIECIFQREAMVEQANATTSTNVTVAAPGTVKVNPTADDAMSVTSAPVAVPLEPVVALMPLIPTTFSSDGKHSTLNDSISSMGGANVHRAAIESLQKRKKRQGVNNKISQMVAVTAGNASLLERSRSVGDVGQQTRPNSTASFQPMRDQLQGQDHHQQATFAENEEVLRTLPSPRPIAPSNLARFASTGLVAPNANGFTSNFPPLATSIEGTSYMQSAQQQQQQQSHQHQSIDFYSENTPHVWHPVENGRSVSEPFQQLPQYQLHQPFQQQFNHQMMQNQLQQQQHMGVARRRSTLSEFSQEMIHGMLLRLESGNDGYGVNYDNGINATVAGQVGTFHGRQISEVGGGEMLAPATFVTSNRHSRPAGNLSTDDDDDAIPVSAEAAAAAYALGFGRPKFNS